MTNQEFFNVVWRGLKAQGFQQAKVGRRCVLFDPGTGHHCAVGHVFAATVRTPHYTNWMGAVRSLVDRGVEECVIQEATNCHDYGDTPERMEKNLRAMAKMRNLEIPND